MEWNGEHEAMEGVMEWQEGQEWAMVPVLEWEVETEVESVQEEWVQRTVEEQEEDQKLAEWTWRKLEKVSARHSGKLFNTEIDRQGEKRKGGQLFHFT
eukprot:s521_g28.t1